MARVTVEDCIDKIPNRFELVMSAAQRVRDITAGAAITVDRDRDKNPVVALREIADETINLDVLKEGMIKRNQQLLMGGEESEEEIDVIDGEEAWANMAREALESDSEDLNIDSDDMSDTEAEAAEFSAASAEAIDDDAF